MVDLDYGRLYMSYVLVYEMVDLFRVYRAFYINLDSSFSSTSVECELLYSGCSLSS